MERNVDNIQNQRQRTFLRELVLYSWASLILSYPDSRTLTFRNSNCEIVS